MIRRWVPISFIVVAVALALAGGAVLAAGGGDNGDNDRRTDIFERAAELLGIGPLQLEDAHDRATRELRDEKLASIIEKMVSGGIIDQNEADSFTAWLTDRPESAAETLFPHLAPFAFSLHSRSFATPKLSGPGLHTNGDVIELMAELLGVEEQELIEALKTGAADVASDSRLAAMHMAIDARLESGSLTADEAAELHAWVDDTPQWLLDADLSSRVLPAFGSGWGERVVPSELEGFRFRLPFGRGHFQRGDGDFFHGDGKRKFEFDFEFHLPEGNFRFGPGGFDGLNGLEGFHGFEGIEGHDNLEGLFDRFRGFGGHGFRFPPLIEPDGTGDSSGPSTTSA